MQKTPHNTMPPRGRQQQIENAGRQQGQQAHQGGENAPASPALAMARRIRNEQGQERAKQYLLAMEPFLAPLERAHIAEQLGVTLPARPAQQDNARQQPFSSQPHQAQTVNSGMPFGQGGGMNNPMQMMQMLSGLGGMGKKSGGQGGMGDPVMLAQMLGSLMGKK